MYSDEELKLGLAVVAAAALMRGEAPGIARALCARPECAGAGGGDAATAQAGAIRASCGRARAPLAWPGGAATSVAAWPTPAVPAVPAASAASAVPAAPAVAALAGADGAQPRVLFAVDIAGFTDARRDEEVQLALRRALYGLLTEAFEASGVTWAECVHEDRGDGVVVLVPQGVPAIIMIDPLLHQLRVALRRHNRLASEVARIGLRVAVHMGQVHRDEHGLAGTAVNHLFRLLDAPVVKATVAAAGSEPALIVSEHYYDSVVRQRPSLIESTAFRRVPVRTKQTRDHGWIWMPAAVPVPMSVPVPVPVLVAAGGAAVAARSRLMPLGVLCSVLWAGGTALIASMSLDVPLGVGLALGATAVTGIVTAVTSTALALRAPAGTPGATRRTPGPLLDQDPVPDAGQEPPGADDLDERAR